MSAFIALLLLVPSALLRGWALSVMWGWFVVPTFGAPRLAVVPAIGVSLVVSLLVSDTKPDDRDALEILLAGVLSALLMLGFGWVFHLFM